MSGADLLGALRPEPRRDRYGRYLLPDPATGRDRAWTRTTTLAKSASDSFALTNWQLRMAVKGLASRQDLYLLAAATHVDDRETLNKIATDAKEAAASSAGANAGTALHAFTERIDIGEQVEVPPPWDADLAAYRAAVANAGVEVLPEYVERVIVNRTYGVAGTFDRIARVGGRLVIADLKTGRDLSYGWQEIAVQLAIYATADAVFDTATGRYEPMPEVDQHRGLVIHLPVGQGRCSLQWVDLDAGRGGADLCAAVRSWRARRDLATPYTQSEKELLALVRDAGSVDTLYELFERFEQNWTPELTAAAAARKAHLAGA